LVVGNNYFKFSVEDFSGPTAESAQDWGAINRATTSGAQNWDSILSLQANYCYREASS